MVIYDHTYPDNPIMIGEDAEDNDLIIKKASSNDLWFHISGHSSAHIILSQTKHHPINKSMINYCAALLKKHSKYNYKLKIIYTSIKNIRKTGTKGCVKIIGKPKYIFS